MPRPAHFFLCFYFFFLYFLLVRFDFYLLVFYVEAQPVVDAHVLVGNPNHRKEGEKVATPVIEKQLISCDRENPCRDVVAEAIFASE